VTNQSGLERSRLTRCIVIAMAFMWLCVGTAGADAVTDWNNVVVSATVSATPSRPNPETAIAAAYMHIAIYDAIAAIDGRYTPFATTIDNAPAGASKDAAAAQAAYEILSFLYPAVAPYTTIAAAVAAAYTTALNAVPNGQAKTDGMNVGHASAQGLLLKRQNDGFRANVPYTFPPLGPGVYQKTPGTDGTITSYAGPAAPWVAKFKPLTLLSAHQFRVDGPPPLGSTEWAEDFNEVKNFGAASDLPNSRSAEQEEIGLFYGNINAQLQISKNLQSLAKSPLLDLDISETARFFAQVYVTSSDSFVGCWDSKYHFNFWRPITAIQHADIDGNDATQQDAGWRPQIVTPGHPEWPSAHGCTTSAYAHAIAEFFGTKRLPGGIDLIGGTPNIHHFDSTDQIIREIIDARVYNGVHYRTSVIQGSILGRKVAQWVAKFYFQPVDAHIPQGPKRR
jgi:PAP2 superfamily protein